MHPDDARALGLEDGQWVCVTSSVGSIELPLAVIAGGRRGVVTVAHGWGSRVFDPNGVAEPAAFGANRNVLVDRVHFDVLSQTPALNGTPVRVEAVAEQALPGLRPVAVSCPA
jgi:formate dehydrogenase